MACAVAFSGKATIVKPAYRHGVDAITLITLRTLEALGSLWVLAGVTLLARSRRVWASH